MKKLTLISFWGALIVFLYSLPEVSKNFPLSVHGTFGLMSWEEPFSQELLEEEIQKLEFPYPHIVYAQSILETGHFTSTIFLENNNLFGMKRPQVRSTFAVGTNRNHAVYTHWSESLYDYKIYYDIYLSEKSEQEVYDYLKRVYAQDPRYVKKIKSIIASKNLKNLFE